MGSVEKKGRSKHQAVEEVGSSQRLRPVPATAANHVWTYDFVHDACANGQKLKMLTVIQVRQGQNYSIFCG
jgi:hypothetical protein